MRGMAQASHLRPIAAFCGKQASNTRHSHAEV